MSQNTPATHKITALFGNAFVVAAIQALLNALILPTSCAFLAKLKHGLHGVNKIPLELVVNVYRSQIGASLVFEVIGGLLAPMLSMVILDGERATMSSARANQLMCSENCLRFYLLFVQDLKSLMDAWGVASTGSEAYRHGTCSRSLITQYSYG